MNLQRAAALWLTVILAVFNLAVAGVLTANYYKEEKAGILKTEEITNLTKRLESTPKDEAIKEEIRRKDVVLRKAYFRERERFKWGGYLLLIGLIGCVSSARWFFSCKPSQSPAISRAVKTASPNAIGMAMAVAAAGAILFLALGFGAIFGGAGLPPPSAGKAPATGTPAAATAFKENWPCFRGPDNIGVASAGDWPTTWSVAEKRNVVWAAEIPLEGKSSPIVWGDRVFLTGAGKKEQRVMCFDRATGRLLWDSIVRHSRQQEEVEVIEDAGFAAPTPATDGKRVYAMFAVGVLAAFDFDGRQQWTKDLGKPDSAYGHASSPILHENTLILQFDQGTDPEQTKSQLLGFDTATGEIRWRTPRPVVNSWSSPAIIRTPQRVELVACGAPYVIAYDPVAGGELWRAKGLDGDVVPSPTFGGGLVFAANDGAQAMAIRPGGKGDGATTSVVWTAEEGLPDISSPVTDGKRLLLVAPGGQLTCYDAQQGKLLWEQRLEEGASASAILAGDLVFLACEDGLTRVFELADTYRPRGAGDVGEPLYATPAFADSHLYIRGKKHLFCIGRTQ